MLKAEFVRGIETATTAVSISTGERSKSVHSLVRAVNVLVGVLEGALCNNDT